jgi:CRP-like cAMP-binding protein
MSNPKDIEQRIEKLRHISLFDEIRDDSQALRLIADLVRLKKMARGKVVFEEGETGDELYIVKSGAVEIQKKTSQGDKYTVTSLPAEKNAFFGEVALLDRDRRSATVVCISDCEFYTLTRDQFIELGNAHAKIGLGITRAISRILCARLRKSSSDLVTLFGALVNEVVESGGLAD